MITGIGTDIINVNRVERAAARWGERFLDRLFTAGERSYCQGSKLRWQCYAARIAAKEAVLKALGTGLAGCRWTDVEVTNNSSGRPRVNLSGGAARIARDRGVKEVLISLSHDGHNAVAFAVAITQENGAGCQNLT